MTQRRSWPTSIAIFCQLLILGSVVAYRETVLATGPVVRIGAEPRCVLAPVYFPQREFVVDRSPLLSHPFHARPETVSGPRLAEVRTYGWRPLWLELLPSAGGSSYQPGRWLLDPLPGVLALRGATAAPSMSSVAVYGYEPSVPRARAWWCHPSRATAPLLDLEVALGPDGTAYLKAERLPRYGLRLTVQLSAAGDRPEHHLRLALHNDGTEPVAVVVPPANATFTIAPAWGEDSAWRVVPRPPPAHPLGDADVRLLASGAEYAAEIDLAAPEWFVKEPGREEPCELGWRGTGLTGGRNATVPDPVLYGSAPWKPQFFRVLYQAPPLVACAPLREHERIWHEPVTSTLLQLSKPVGILCY